MAIRSDDKQFRMKNGAVEVSTAAPTSVLEVSIG